MARISSKGDKDCHVPGEGPLHHNG
jgi:hypothetical protein